LQISGAIAGIPYRGLNDVAKAHEEWCGRFSTSGPSVTIVTASGDGHRTSGVRQSAILPAIAYVIWGTLNVVLFPLVESR